MKKIKILQVGVGKFGKIWIEIIKKSPEWELAGIVDINRESLQSAAREYNIPEEKCFTSVEEAIRKTGPSAMINATPPRFHKNVSLIAFDAGLDVIVEKLLLLYGRTAGYILLRKKKQKRLNR
ncbi:MAG TPA: Gfo/Idh/MocA family oxidoreductase [bacterium]|nr:Gfo/Idh/MocA family oxidoreductase [bacterium]